MYRGRPISRDDPSQTFFFFIVKGARDVVEEEGCIPGPNDGSF